MSETFYRDNMYGNYVDPTDTIMTRLDGHDADLAQNAQQTTITPTVIKIQDALGITIHSPTSSQLASLKALGFKYVRIDLTWSSIETTQGVYNFSTYDTYHSAIISNGLVPYYILDYTNTLYGSNTDLSTTNMQNGFIAYALACVNHYKNNNVIWEIYNEPNGHFWSPQTSNTPSQYTSVVKQLYSQIKTADPTGTVVAPALATNGANWFESACQAGLLNSTDAVTVHPYTASNPETNQATYDTFMALIRKYANKPIDLWWGEFGYSTVPSWDGTGNNAIADEATQAKYLLRTLFLNVMNGVKKTIFYQAYDPVSPNNAHVEDWFGIYKGDGTPKQAVTSIQNIAPSMANYHYVDRIQSNGEDYILKFVNDSNQIAYVVWTTTSSHSITVGGQTVTVTDSPTAIFNAQDTAPLGLADNLLLKTRKAKDAGVLAAYQNSLLGIGANTGGYTLQNTDLNTMFTQGLNIPVNGNCTNQPSSGMWGRLMVFGQVGVECAQMFIQDRTNRLFFRTKTVDNGWYPWTEFANTTQLSTSSTWATQTLLGSVTGQFKLQKTTVSGVTRVGAFFNISNMGANGIYTIASLPSGFIPTNTFYGWLVCPQDKFNKLCQFLIDSSGNVKIYTNANFTTSDYATGMVEFDV